MEAPRCVRCPTRGRSPQGCRARAPCRCCEITEGNVPGGTILYKDDDHLSIAGASRLGEVLLQSLTGG
ncbi:MAG: hypothetical protein H5U17_10745 [Defluviimonas sp.]|nr:hypothetical protein [Defluviimonas sp.]